MIKDTVLKYNINRLVFSEMKDYITQKNWTGGSGGMEKKRIILSTGSKNKVKEIKAILDDLDFEIIDKNEAGYPDIDVEENGDTLEENSKLKAMGIWELSGGIVLADDTGLFVDALDGDPGVHSARYSGEKASDKDNRDKLLKNLEGVEDRKARFRTVVTIIDEKGKVTAVEGISEGVITKEERGTSGFGYDSIFLPVGYDKTFGELTDFEKDKISHRARALEKLKEYFKKI